MSLPIPTEAMVRRMSADRLHDWLRRNGYEPEDVAALAPPIRDAIYDRLDNDPRKLREIARLMEKED